jgi:hypothetical protein
VRILVIFCSHAITEDRPYQPGRTDLTCVYKFLNLPAAGVKTIHEGLHQKAAG